MSDKYLIDIWVDKTDDETIREISCFIKDNGQEYKMYGEATLYEGEGIMWEINIDDFEDEQSAEYYRIHKRTIDERFRKYLDDNFTDMYYDTDWKDYSEDEDYEDDQLVESIYKKVMKNLSIKTQKIK